MPSPRPRRCHSLLVAALPELKEIGGVGASGEFETAVDGEDLAGDPGGGGFGEVHDPGGHLLWSASAAERDAGDLILLDLLHDGPRQAGGGQGLAVGGARGEGVDADAL